MKKVILINLGLILLFTFIFLQFYQFFKLPKFNYKIWNTKPITFYPNSIIRVIHLNLNKNLKQIRLDLM